MSEQHYYYVWREKTGARHSWTIPRRVQAEDSADALIASELKLGEGEIARVVRMTATTKFEGITMETTEDEPLPEEKWTGGGNWLDQ